MPHFMKIMLVEDDPKVCNSFRKAFRQYRMMSLVYRTDSESQAFKYLERHDVDVLILDIKLREGDGLSLLHQIETYGLEKPFIIVVTNCGSGVTLSNMRAHGADYIYRKTNPAYSPERVLHLVEKIFPYQIVEKYNKEIHTLAVSEHKKEKTND